MNPKFKEYLFYISAILLLLTAALYITGWSFIPYLYIAASAGVALVYLASPYKGSNLRLRRLHIQEALAAILLLVSAYFMYKEKNEWFLFLALSAVIQVYVAFIKARELKKEGK